VVVFLFEGYATSGLTVSRLVGHRGPDKTQMNRVGALLPLPW
jgi:hypothetical protein